MSESSRTRRRRSTAELQRLEAARRRRAEQLEREREKERRVDAALGPFAEAATAIEAVERRLAQREAVSLEGLERRVAELERQKAARVAEHERRCAQLRVAAEEEIAGWRAVMGDVVRQIRESEVSVSAAAEMLGVSSKTVRELARVTRAADVREGSADDAGTGGEIAGESGEAGPGGFGAG